MKRIVLSTLAALVTVGCGSELGDPDVSADPAGPCVDSVADSALTEYATHTDITIALADPECVGEPGAVGFQISMTNHTCSIPGYDEGLETHVVVESAQGAWSGEALEWSVYSTDAHHPSGLLVLRPGELPAVPCDSEWLALVLTGVDLGEGESLRFEWAGPALDRLRDCGPGR